MEKQTLLPIPTPSRPNNLSEMTKDELYVELDRIYAQLDSDELTISEKEYRVKKKLKVSHYISVHQHSKQNKEKAEKIEDVVASQIAETKFLLYVTMQYQKMKKIVQDKKERLKKILC
jgi:hypothetical protein